ncbi:MAG TPA: hypothetical protein VLD57_09125, partial [Blastocatellia bacterium]|nr:hypothetical protein [Blastocatellia bacterium]
MSEYLNGRAVAAFLLTISIIIISTSVEARGVPGKSTYRKSKSIRKPVTRSAPSCNQCTGRSAAKRNARPVARKSKQQASCYPKGYVDPKIAKNLNAALRDMRRAGIKPVITSTWRSS